MWKPFKPPAFKSPLLKSSVKPSDKSIVVSETDNDDDSAYKSPPPKRKRLIHIVEDDDPPPLKKLNSIVAINAPRKPLLSLKSHVTLSQAGPPSTEGPEGYFLVLW